MQVHHHGHGPACQRGHQDDAQHVRHALDARGEVDFRHVESAGDERETGDHEQHGANVGRIVRERDWVENADESQGAGAGERRRGHAHKGDEELVQMVCKQPATHPLAKARAHERTDHVVWAAAEQEHEGRAG